MNKNRYGTPFPLGASQTPSGWNFAVYSKQPVTELVWAPLHSPNAVTCLHLDPEKNRTGSIWHIFVATDETDILYAFTIKDRLFVDPYARLIRSGSKYGDNAFRNGIYKTTPIAIAFDDDGFNWEGDKSPNIPCKDLVIYELHVRGMTQHPSSHARHPGTYLGMIEKIPYLKELGVNAVEFLPIFEFDEADNFHKNPKTKKPLVNYWGYAPLSFFSPMQRYATTDDPIEGLRECKEMIKALHKANIEVILDIVFNHTGEGNQYGRSISWKGFADSDYYLKDAKGEYLNFSGCGNTLNCNHPVVSDMIIESLRYWVTYMHVDGFRFDLASIMMRGQDGKALESSPLLERITQDPVISRTKLIAEPWDAAGLHQVGHFFQTPWKGPEQWMEWNDDYRSGVRHFIKGTPGYAGKFATKLCGSQDLYGTDGCPLNSINYVSCHDGFTLRDLVSYQKKHNEENGEGNRDGVDTFDTWNSGVEGETKDSHIEVLRQRQMKNFCVALCVSSGIPMIGMGDEYGHTKHGNNNTWCQDNELSWFIWSQLESSASLLHFWKEMIRFRKENPLIKRDSFLGKEDIEWHGMKPNSPDWSNSSHFVAYTLLDHEQHHDLYIAFNAQNVTVNVQLPKTKPNTVWSLVVNTALLPPQDFSNAIGSHSIVHGELKMAPYSSVILKAVNVYGGP